LLTDAHERVLALLTASKSKLEGLAEVLLREETLELDRLTTILGPARSSSEDVA
jgi:ATP-dependent Zn protease